MEAFEFTHDDLLSNRANKLTQSQQRKINSHIRIAEISSRLALGACIGTMILYLGIGYALRPENGYGQALPYLIFAAALFIGIFIFFILVGNFKGRHLRDGQISVVEGIASPSIKKLNHGRWSAYYVSVGDVKFQLSSQDQFDALRADVRYRVFYIQYPPTHIILSIESMD